MQIVAVLPEPVSPGSHNTSRQFHQFNCLGSVVHSIVDEWVKRDALDAHSLKIFTKANTEISAAEIIKAMGSATLLIDVSGLSIADKLDDSWHGQTVTVSPAFPGSFAQNTIKLIASSKKPVPAELPSSQFTLKDQPRLCPPLHYAKFSPLPASSTDLVYKRGSTQLTSNPQVSEHALIALTYTSSTTLLNDIETDKNKLASLIRRFEWITSATLIIDCCIHSGISVRSLANAEKTIKYYLADIPGFSVSVQSPRSIGYTNLYSLMTKSVVGLFAGSALYPDALRVRLPVCLWRQPDGRETELNTFWDDPPLTDNMSVSLKQIATRQQTQFDRTAENAVKLGMNIDNDKIILKQTIEQILRRPAEPHKIAEPSAIDISTAQPVIDLPFDRHQRSTRQKFIHKIVKSQRKLTKLRQSPIQFVQDSNHPLIKKLKPLLSR